MHGVCKGIRLCLEVKMSEPHYKNYKSAPGLHQDEAHIQVTEELHKRRYPTEKREL